MYLLVSVVVLALVLGSLADIITRQDGQIQHLPKTAWIMLVLFLPLVGSVLWFAVGRDWSTGRIEPMPFGDPRRREASTAFPEQLRTEAELAALDAEIRASERAARIRRLEAEVEARAAESARRSATGDTAG